MISKLCQYGIVIQNSHVICTRAFYIHSDIFGYFWLQSKLELHLFPLRSVREITVMTVLVGGCRQRLSEPNLLCLT